MCETPKSPPGDYKPGACACGRACIVPRVKHLNPRQGITNEVLGSLPDGDGCHSSVKHLNPRQGITNILPASP